MYKIIINADDIGINEIVTQNIERLVEDKKISSTTIMANGKCLDEVKHFALLHPEISFGVHLCLSEFESLTKSEVLHKYGVTDKNGNFIYQAIFGLKLFPHDLRQAIKNELCAQINKLQMLSIPLSHCDSHHHVHTIPALKELFAEVVNDSGFKKIRISSEYITLRERLHIISDYRKRRINSYYKSHFVTTDKFFSYGSFLRINGIITAEVIELMCHPGHPGKAYQEEICKLNSGELNKIMDFQMITYNEI